MKSIFRCLTLVVLSAAAGQLHAQQQVGRVLLAAGDAVAVRGSQTVRLTLGSPIQDRDVLRTGASSNLQVRFNDESITSLRENSELRIEQFRFSGQEDGSERAIFRLLKGGLRTVTGLVGRTNKTNYSLSSMTSTIGIRGSDFSIRACQQDCVKADGSRERDGVFGSVHGQSHGSNAINVANPVTNRTFGIGQHFHDDGKVIQQLLAQPEVVTSRLEGRGKTAKPAGTGQELAAAGGAIQDSRSTPLPAIDTTLGFVAPETGTGTTTSSSPPVTAGTQTGSSIIAGGGIPTVPGGSSVPTIAFVGAIFDSLGGPTQTGAGGGFLVTSDMVTSPAGAADSLATQQALLEFFIPAGFHAKSGGGAFATKGISGMLVIDETQSNSLNAHWGRWLSGSLTEQDGSPSPIPAGANNQFHYLYAQLTPAEVVAAKTGSFALFYTGLGTTPTNNLGELGTFGAGSGTINFTTRQITYPNVTVSFPLQSWSFPAHTTALNIVAGKGAFTDSTVNGSCGGSTCSGSAIMGTTGAVAGTRGDHVLAGHQARTTSGTPASMQTTKIYSCSPSC